MRNSASSLITKHAAVAGWKQRVSLVWRKTVWNQHQKVELRFSPYLAAFDTANAKMGAERHRQKTKVIYCVSDLDNTYPKWKTNEVRTLATVATAARGNITLEIAVGPRRCIARKRTLFEPCTNAFSFARIHRQSLPSFVKAWESAESITHSGCMVTRFWRRKQQPKPFMKWSWDHLTGSFQDLQKIVRSKPRPVQASQVVGVRDQ